MVELRSDIQPNVIIRHGSELASTSDILKAEATLGLRTHLSS